MQYYNALLLKVIFPNTGCNYVTFLIIITEAQTEVFLWTASEL